MEKLPPKEVQCNCGHTFTIDRKRFWCKNCANPVFYYPEDKRAYKRHKIYIFTVAISAITFLTYLFLEIIVRPYFG